eukprot:CAMPEP_0206005418 /NCGR_PEP_ID=MMETSP1464-20131121/4564_1 /ASSEMBLY_ACC=CAM_ASM_001124 /TAXON_ID=119497 /ORGANISM="Exanthemachrysis gayraliae, Strain RCC1523" /LENGTH=103 /DNA_ID=CAMNT_0053378855 /DNA_START=147 /DNA_END=454 /DNA_ORIENTATION=+
MYAYGRLAQDRSTASGAPTPSVDSSVQRGSGRRSTEMWAWVRHVHMWGWEYEQVRQVEKGYVHWRPAPSRALVLAPARPLFRSASAVLLLVRARDAAPSGLEV